MLRINMSGSFNRREVVQGGELASGLVAGSVDMLLIRALSLLFPCYLNFSVLLFFIGLLVYPLNIMTLFIHTPNKLSIFAALPFSFPAGRTIG